MLNGHTERVPVRGRAEGPRRAGGVATSGWSSRGATLPHFDGLVDCIEEMFVTGKPVYPVERTLLTTGALAFLFESRVRKERVATPELAVAYRAPRHAYFQRS